MQTKYFNKIIRLVIDFRKFLSSFLVYTEEELQSRICQRQFEVIFKVSQDQISYKKTNEVEKCFLLDNDQ